MIPFHAEIAINRPVEQVFRFVADPLNYPKWMSGVTYAESLAGTPSGVGSKVRLVGKVAFWKFDGPMEITEYEANRRLGIWTMIPGAMQFKATWIFEPDGPTKTRIVESGEAGMLGFWKLLEPLFAGELKNGEVKELEKIKTLLESSTESVRGI